MFLLFMKFVLSLVLILLAVAFFTLLERKVLGYNHNRLGPNKVGFLGVFQPFSDALKLFSKLDFKQGELLYGFFIFSPLLGLFLMIFLWSFFSFPGVIFYSSFSFILFISVSSLSVYFLLYSGWSSNTKYSLLGSFRSSSQSVSYEVIMILCFLSLVFLWCSLSFNHQKNLLGAFFLFTSVLFCWFLSCLAESNRSPFDFSEGESELVSGFNTEYSGGFFSLIFISEYGSIIYLSFLTALLFFESSLFSFFLCVSMMYVYLWVRCSYPRLRYDFLLVVAWKGLSIFLMGPLVFSFVF